MKAQVKVKVFQTLITLSNYKFYLGQNDFKPHYFI
jgi:hypothetical protein